MNDAAVVAVSVYWCPQLRYVSFGRPGCSPHINIFTSTARVTGIVCYVHHSLGITLENCFHCYVSCIYNMRQHHYFTVPFKPARVQSCSLVNEIA